MVVVAGGNSAGQTVLNLANAGGHVTAAIRSDSVGARMSAYLAERVERHPPIDVRLRTQVTALRESVSRFAAVALTDASGASQGVPARALLRAERSAKRVAAAVDEGGTAVALGHRRREELAAMG